MDPATLSITKFSIKCCNADCRIIEMLSVVELNIAILPIMLSVVAPKVRFHSGGLNPC